MSMSDELRDFETEKTNAILNEIDNTSKEINKVGKAVVNMHKTLLETNSTKHGFKEIQKESLKNATMIVKEYDSTYIGDISLATDIYHAQKIGMKLRQLEIQLRGGAVAFESGQFLDSIGDIKLGKMSLNPKELIGGVFRKMNEETFFRPTAMGTGTVNLESSFKFITLLPVPEPTRMVLEKGIYLASIGDFEFKTTKNLNASYMLFSKKSIFQTEVTGKGIVALELPVHQSELQKHDITPDSPYRVNGDYVLFWTGNLKRKVIPMGKLFGSMMSGTGLVEEYSGTGTVWTASTLGYYKNIAKDLENTGFGGGRTEDLEDNSDKGKRATSFLQKLFIKE